MKLTKQVVKSLIGKKGSKDLDLSKKEISYIESDAFDDATTITFLDLSNNRLKFLEPCFSKMTSLCRLDLRDNQLILPLDYLSHVSQVKELYLDGNPMTAGDKYIAIHVMPELAVLDGRKCLEKRNLLTKLTAEAEHKLDKVWSSHEFAEDVAKHSKDVSSVNMDRISKDCLRKVIKQMSISDLWSPVVEYVLKEKIALKVKEEIDRQSKDVYRKHRSFQSSSHNSSQEKILMTDEETDENDYKGSPSKKKKMSTPSPVKMSSQEDFNFMPFLAVRSHSFEENPLDSHTQVWKVAFEPQDNESADKTCPPNVATCGGNHVCIFESKTGRLLAKFSDSDPYDDLYAIAWTSVTGDYGQREDILAVGGTGRKVILLNPRAKKRITKFNAHHNDINALLFHPHQTTLLFTGSYDKKIKVWDIRSLVFSDETKKMTNLSPLLDVDINNKILTFAYSIDHNILFVGGESGMTIWKDVVIDEANNGTWSQMKFDRQSECIIDGLAILPNNMLAVKQSRSGRIHIISVLQIISDIKRANLRSRLNSFKEITLKRLIDLDYCRTKVDFFQLHFANNLLVCGDDVGRVWSYDLSSILSKVDSAVKQRSPEDIELIPADFVLDWPSFNNPLYKNRKVIDLSRPNVINGLALDPQAGHLITVSNINLITFWRRNMS